MARPMGRVWVRGAGQGRRRKRGRPLVEKRALLPWAMPRVHPSLASAGTLVKERKGTWGGGRRSRRKGKREEFFVGVGQVKRGDQDRTDDDDDDDVPHWQGGWWW